MSFILDALKKSEAERRRQTGPTLYEMRAAPRRAALPLWVLVLLAVLALNLLVLVYLLIRKPASPTEPGQAVAMQTVPAAAPAPIGPAAVTASPASSTATASAPQGPFRAPAQEPLREPAYIAPVPTAAAPASRPADGGPISSLADMRTNGGSLPDLRLSLHVYDVDPSRRYLLLNGMRLREGDVMPDGLRVERITEDGAILGWRGRRFLLPRGE